MATKVVFSRVDLAANFTTANPILALGETGYEQDTGRLKIGDGVTAWNSLPYKFEDQSSTYEVFESAATTIGASYTVIALDTEVTANADFTLGSNVVTFNFNGTVVINYSYSGDNTTGGRTSTQSALFVNSAELVRSRTFGYHRSVANGEDTAHKTVTLTVASGDTVGIRTLEYGSGAISLAGQSNMVIEVRTKA